MKSHKFVGIIVAVLMLLGCKIEIAVPEGGSVSSKSASFNCSSGQRCQIDVYDIYFNEDFVATPAPGYIFEGWREKNRGLCGGSLGSCHLHTSSFAGNPFLMSILESDQVFYLEPVFKKDPGNPNPAPHYLLYGGYNSNDYLGCLSCGRYEIESVCNANGSYGSRYASRSIWNQHGSYGSVFSDTSPWNEYAASPPAIYDTSGLFHGYLTANQHAPYRTTSPVLIDLTNYASGGLNELEAVRNWFCE